MGRVRRKGLRCVHWGGEGVVEIGHDCELIFGVMDVIRDIVCFGGTGRHKSLKRKLIRNETLDRLGVVSSFKIASYFSLHLPSSTYHKPESTPPPKFLSKTLSTKRSPQNVHQVSPHIYMRLHRQIYLLYQALRLLSRTKPSLSAKLYVAKPQPDEGAVTELYKRFQSTTKSR